MSKRGRFSKWIAIIALVGFGLGLLGLLSGSASGPGKGEVGAILYGAFMMLLFFFSAIALFVAGWSWFWHVKWLRIAGFVVILLTVIGSFAGPRMQTAYHKNNYEQKQKDRAELSAVRDASYDQLRSNIDNKEAALAVAGTFNTAVGEIQFRRIKHSAPHDVFHKVHEIYMSVFHEHALPAFEERSEPYGPALCARFGEQFLPYLATNVQKERGRAICPGGY